MFKSNYGAARKFVASGELLTKPEMFLRRDVVDSECEKPVKLNFNFRIFGYMKFDLVNSDLLREHKRT